MIMVSQHLPKFNRFLDEMHQERGESASCTVNAIGHLKRCVIDQSTQSIYEKML